MSHSLRSLILLSLVFFTWGVLTSANSILVPHFQSLFELSYQQSMWVQMAFYIAPFAVCIPTSMQMAKRGYKFSLTAALILTVVGALSLYLALKHLSFVAALLSVFVVAMGVAALQVVANPYVTVTGEMRQSIRRLTIASTLNAVGTTAGPILLALAMITIGIANIYVMLALLIVVVLLLLRRYLVVDVKSEQHVNVTSHLVTLRKHPQFLFGALMIFVYVGVEVAIGTVTINYLSDIKTVGLSATTATTLMSIYWAGSLLGRLIYSYFAPRCSALVTLLVGALVASSLILLAIITSSLAGGIALVSIGLVNSFMYPIIFSRAIESLGDSTGAASAILIMCGIGGGIIPMLQASTIASWGVANSYWVPLLGYILLSLYAAMSLRTERTAKLSEVGIVGQSYRDA